MNDINQHIGFIRRGPLIVTGLIVLLCAGVAIPGVAKLRSSAARISCQNNVKQIGLATLTYCDAMRRYPPATIPNHTLEVDIRFSWLFEILPYTESQDWYRRADFSLSWNDSRNRYSTAFLHPLYDCEHRPYQIHIVGKTSFIGITGVGPDAATLPLTHPDAGLFGYDRVVKSTDVPSPSTTILLMETMTGGPWAQGGPSTVRGIEPGLAFGPTASFGSRHTEGGLFGTPGVNAGMADGSVRFIKNTVHQSVLESLARLRGEKLDW